MANTVIRKSYANIRDEKVAAGTITPGMLVERTSADKVQAHSTAGGSAAPLFALEDAPQGNGLTDDYSANDNVLLWRPVPGEQVQGIADATSGTTIAIGDFLESAGDGSLRVLNPASAGVTEFPNSLVGVALEAAVAGANFTFEVA
jgi:hypothetical protein